MGLKPEDAISISIRYFNEQSPDYNRSLLFEHVFSERTPSKRMYKLSPNVVAINTPRDGQSHDFTLAHHV
jgi:hypothetical protein